MASRQQIRDHLVAAAWGAAEGSFFFLVPDVWLTRVATRQPRRALAANAPALVGALAGGAATWWWGRRTPAARSAAALALVPGIAPSLVTRVERDVERDGFLAMVAGPTRGIPYKIYARTAGLRGEGLVPFLAWSIPARLPRFLLVTAGAVALRRASAATLGERTTARLAGPTHTVGWIAFYTWYFRTMRVRADLDSSP